MAYKSIFKRISVIFLRGLVVLVGMGAFLFLLWEPQVEGRNVNATLFEIYFKDPFLAYAYLGSIPFFVALYQAFKMLGDIERKKVFSRRSLKALRTIKHCALIVLGFVVPAVGYLFIVRPGDDIAGGVFMGLLITLGSILVVIGAAVFERRMRDAASTKSRSD